MELTIFSTGTPLVRARRRCLLRLLPPTIDNQPRAGRRRRGRVVTQGIPHLASKGRVREEEQPAGGFVKWYVDVTTHPPIRNRGGKRDKEIGGTTEALIRVCVPDRRQSRPQGSQCRPERPPRHHRREMSSETFLYVHDTRRVMDGWMDASDRYCYP
jgi:hypothetical protein